MIGFAIVGVLLGSVLGFRFKVFVIFPTMSAVFTLISASGLAAGNGARAIALTMVVMTLSVQLGYFAGGAVSMLVAHTRLRAPHPLVSSGS